MDARLARAAAGAALAAATAAAALLWLSLPDQTLVFDGVMFAGFVERAVEEWRRELLNPRHLLFNPAHLLLRDALAAAGLRVGAYRLFQAVNALLGAAGLWLFGDLLRRLLRDPAAAALGAALLGASWTWGTRATEGQVYMALAFGGVWILWSCVRLLEAPSAGRAAHLAAALAASTLFHAAAAFLLPAAALAFWSAFTGRRAAALAALAAAVAAVAAAYAAAFGSLGLVGFFAKATDFRAAGPGFFSGLAASLLSSGGLGPGERLLLVLRESGWAWAPMPAPAAAAAGLALVLAAGGAAAALWRELDAFRRAAALCLALAWAGLQALNAFWLGGLFFQPIPAAASLAFLAAALSPRLPAAGSRARRSLLGMLAAAALALAAWTTREGLIPQSRPESNPGVRLAAFVRDHTVPSSWVVITGMGLHNAKVYIPNFSRRSREVLEYYFDRMPKDRALEALAAFIGRQAAHGVPLYLLSDLVESEPVREEMRRRWSLEMGEIQAAFGPGRAIEAARGPQTAVWLFAPDARRAELFAGLSYSLFTESEAARLAETAALLRELAREMPPAERERAARLLESSGWGFALIQEGFSPYMGEERRKTVPERERLYAKLREGPDFWLRAGNLFRMLGLKGRALAAWRKALELSGDEGLRREIAALERAP